MRARSAQEGRQRSCCTRVTCAFLSMPVRPVPPGALRGGLNPYDSRGVTRMLDVLFVGVTILVFAVLALIVKGVEKL